MNLFLALALLWCTSGFFLVLGYLITSKIDIKTDEIFGYMFIPLVFGPLTIFALIEKK